MIENVTSLVKKFYSGDDSLDDEETLALMIHAYYASEYLYGMGEMFKLAAKESHRIYRDCRDWAVNRDLIKIEDDIKVAEKVWKKLK